MAGTIPYQYQALPSDHIRLMLISPGGFNDPLQIELDSFDVSQAPEYTALSYCWGNGIPDHDCFVYPGRHLKITSNLHEILQRCKHSADKVHVWADQVCIDQSDDADKIHQIRLMKKICSLATNVIVWLGAEDAETRLVYDIINDIGKEFVEHIKANPGKKFEESMDLRKVHISKLLISHDDAEWVAFRNWFSRPWFRRTWTVQEVVLARQAYAWCGPYKTSWNQLMMVCEIIRMWDKHEKNQLAHLKERDEAVRLLNLTQLAQSLRNGQKAIIGQYMQHSYDLDNLLKATMFRKASIGHDKIYGILGLARDVDVTTFPIDYNTHMTHLFAYTTKRLISQHGDLSILAVKRIAPGLSPRVGPNILPSWVPDYRYDDTRTENRRVNYGPKVFLHGSERLYNATGSSKAEVYADDDLTLRLTGVCLSQIKALSGNDQNFEGNRSIDPSILAGGAWSELAQSCADQNGRYEPTAESVYLAFQRTRIWDYLPGELAAKDRRSRSSSPMHVPEPGVSSTITMATGEMVLSYEPNDKMSGLILDGTTAQKLMVLESGQMGICHRGCMVGDEVWLIMGSDIPYVLRRLETGTHMFKGEAYVHGVMDGEYLLNKYKNTDPSSADVADSEWLENLAHVIPFRTVDLTLS